MQTEKNVLFSVENTARQKIAIHTLEMMFVDTLKKFVSWARRKSYRRGLICHFYIAESQKQYYYKTDYAYFNLFCDSQDWVIKGTTGHGIRSPRGKTSPVPCLNCFEINDKFYDALRRLENEGNEKFELGLILNKRRLRNYFEVIDVSTKPPSLLPPPNECHYYDWPRMRARALRPFNNCDVVRVEIRPSDFRGIPIAVIPNSIVMGMLVKHGDYFCVKKLLREKKLGDISVFPLL